MQNIISETFRQKRENIQLKCILFFFIFFSTYTLSILCATKLSASFLFEEESVNLRLSKAVAKIDLCLSVEVFLFIVKVKLIVFRRKLTKLSNYAVTETLIAEHAAI